MLWTGLLALPSIVRAQPTPLRIIVPAPPGGSTDILARVVSERASALLGQPIIVDSGDEPEFHGWSPSSMPRR